MKIFSLKSRAAFTLAEMITSLGCGSLILAAIVAAGVSLQRSFAAIENYSTAEGNQLRVMDYIAMDCRRARAASVSNNQLQLTLPAYYYNSSNDGGSSGNDNTPVAPALTGCTSSGCTLNYGSGSVVITYLQSGTNFNRQVDIKDSNGNSISGYPKTTAVATNVSTFTVTPQDLTMSVSCSITFFPNFTHMAGSGTWRSGGSAPSNGTGSNGDWYAIDSTASDPTTVGNVYLKSGGSYSLIQNVKATTIYINTFLRNAVARQ